MNNLERSKVLNEKLWKSWEIAALIKLRINWNSTPETASVKTIWERWRQNKVIKKHQMNEVKWLKIQVNVLSLISESRETEKSHHETAWEMVETGMSDEDDDHNSQDDTVLAPLVRGSSWRWGKYLTEMKNISTEQSLSVTPRVSWTLVTMIFIWHETYTAPDNWWQLDH